MYIQTTIGNRIRMRREELNMTQDELAQLLGYKSRSSINKIESGENKLPTDKVAAFAKALDTTTQYIMGVEPGAPKGTSIMVKIPVYGSVKAGFPSTMDDDIVDWTTITQRESASADWFGTVVKGNSMEPLMFEGDTLLVRRQPDVENGGIAVVSVGGTDATVKKVKKMQNSIMLIPLNNEYDPMIYAEADDVRILGRVTEIRRKI